MHEKCLQCTFWHYAASTGQEAQFRQCRSKVTQMLCWGCRSSGGLVRLGVSVGGGGDCLFYKQWEQISIGASLPQPYGEDVLCVGRLLTNPLCWRLETRCPWHHFWSPLMMTWFRCQRVCERRGCVVSSTSTRCIIAYWVMVLAAADESWVISGAGTRRARVTT